MQKSETEKLLRQLWWAGVEAAGGNRSVTAVLAGEREKFDLILGVGKAAGAMSMAALPHLHQGGRVLVVTKYGHWDGAAAGGNITIIEAAHPVSDHNSLRGGQALLDAVRKAGPQCRLLLLVSGGASALAEVPRGGVMLETIRRENERLLASGLDIHAINAERRKFSAIKGGGLLAQFGGRDITVLAISDVRGDDIEIVGSGIGAWSGKREAAYRYRIVASNRIARAAVCETAGRMGLEVRCNEETLYGDVAACADRVADLLREGAPGVYVLGGEPTIVLPRSPGEGGRNQAFAAEIARRINGVDGLTVLVAGSDGTDGPTDAAGGIVGGSSWRSAPGGGEALDRADAGTWLEQAGCRLVTGPTGTNVMDLLVALKQ